MTTHQPLTPAFLDTVLAASEAVTPPERIEQALDDLAAGITAAIGDRSPLILGVMTGAIIPMGRLLSRLDFHLEVDYIHATRYHRSTTGRDLVWLARPQTPLKDRTVLVIDDILDEGHTLAGIIQECRDEGARDVQTAVLVEKTHDRRVAGLTADFAGITVPDRYVYGEGMDYRGYFRNVSGIWAVHPDHED